LNVRVPFFNTLFPVYAKDIYQVGPEGLGLMFTMVGACMAVSAASAALILILLIASPHSRSLRLSRYR